MLPEETATLDAQLDAILLSSGKFYVNPTDRATLLSFVSSMHSTRSRLEPSPLRAPTLQLAELARKRRGQAKDEVGRLAATTRTRRSAGEDGNYAHRYRRDTIRSAHRHVVAAQRGGHPPSIQFAG